MPELCMQPGRDEARLTWRGEDGAQAMRDTSTSVTRCRMVRQHVRSTYYAEAKLCDVFPRAPCKRTPQRAEVAVDAGGTAPMPRHGVYAPYMMQSSVLATSASLGSVPVTRETLIHGIR